MAACLELATNVVWFLRTKPGQISVQIWLYQVSICVSFDIKVYVNPILLIFVVHELPSTVAFPR